MTRWSPPVCEPHDARDERIRQLESELFMAYYDIVGLAPPPFTELLRSYYKCTSTNDSHRWQHDIADKVVEKLPPSSISAGWDSNRANCPLCGGESQGPYQQSFTVPLGLTRHLTGFGNTHQCVIIKAASKLAREYLEDKYGAAERAAKTVADEEKARLTAERKKTETLYKVHPFDPPELIDGGYRSWFGDVRKPDRLEWAEARVRSLGFEKRSEANVQSLEKVTSEYITYADIRSAKKISFHVFGLPLKTRKTLRQSSFDFLDSFKHHLEDKFEVRLNEALERLRK